MAAGPLTPRLRAIAAAVVLGELPMRAIGGGYRPLPPPDALAVGELSAGSGPAIPPVVHQVWRSRTLGRSHARSLRLLQQRNPDFTFHLYLHADADAFMAAQFAGEPIAEVYRRAVFPQMRADIFRYAVLLRRGGVYLDITKGLSQPLAAVVGGEDAAVLSYERNPMPEPPPAAIADRLAMPGHQLVQWCLMAAPGHPFLRRTLDNIVAAADRLGNRPVADPKATIIDLTGPRMLTRSVWQVLTAQPMLTFGQRGIDYGEAVYPLHPRAWVCYAIRPSYAEAAHTPVLRPADQG